MPDQKYIDELTERSRQYEALNNEMFPREQPPIDVRQEIFGPREYPVEQFHSFGVEHPEDIAIAKALDLSPGMAATILPAIRAAKDAPHDEASLLADYGWRTGLAAQGFSDKQQEAMRLEARQRRAEAVAGAKASLRGVNIDFDVLPKTVLDLINVTANAKRHAYEAMPEAMKQTQTSTPPRPTPGIDLEALAEYNRTHPHAPFEVHPSWLG